MTMQEHLPIDQNKEECDEPIHPSTNYLGGVTHAGPIHNQWNVKNLNRDESNWLIEMPNNTFFYTEGKLNRDCGCRTTHQTSPISNHRYNNIIITLLFFQPFSASTATLHLPASTNNMIVFLLYEFIGFPEQRTVTTSIDNI
jgi:hypothetical protein